VDQSARAKQDERISVETVSEPLFGGPYFQSALSGSRFFKPSALPEVMTPSFSLRFMQKRPLRSE
jgi:hypothetical protein